MGNQVSVDEGEERAERAPLKLHPLPSSGRGPILPPVRRLERGGVLGAYGLRLVRLARLALVEDPKEQDPGQLGHVLERPGAVGAPHDVADRLDGGVDGLLGG